jgi:hypothetical protein
MPGSRQQPKLFRLAGSGEIPQTVVSGHNGIAPLVNDQQWPWADLADDLHWANAIDVDSRSIVRECDR